MKTKEKKARDEAMERRDAAAVALAAAGVDCLIEVTALPGGAFAAIARVRGVEHAAARRAIRDGGLRCGLLEDDDAIERMAARCAAADLR